MEKKLIQLEIPPLVFEEIEKIKSKFSTRSAAIIYLINMGIERELKK